jgi:alpha-D-ribose 1-methylphosphonate 5-triphosphate synthase subunit PhnG
VCRKSPLPTSKSALNSGERAVACRKQPSKVDILRSCGMFLSKVRGRLGGAVSPLCFRHLGALGLFFRWRVVLPLVLPSR